MTDQTSTTAQLLRAKRIKSKLTANTLALSCGLSRSYVAKFESGEIAYPSLRAFAKMAVALELSPSELRVVVAAEALR